MVGAKEDPARLRSPKRASTGNARQDREGEIIKNPASRSRFFLLRVLGALELWYHKLRRYNQNL